MGLQETEDECAAGRTAPRVSLGDIEAQIALIAYSAGDEIVGVGHDTVLRGGHSYTVQSSLRTLTVCLLVLRNGFTVVGKSAPVSPENFDPVLARKLAYEDAVRQVWPLMGFALRNQIYAGE